MPDVIVDGKSNGTIAVDFLKGNFPLVVTLFPVDGYHGVEGGAIGEAQLFGVFDGLLQVLVTIYQKIARDRKSTRLNSSHVRISYAVFCLKKKTHVTPIFLARSASCPPRSSCSTGAARVPVIPATSRSSRSWQRAPLRRTAQPRLAQFCSS